jgi:hypothetical protein
MSRCKASEILSSEAYFVYAAVTKNLGYSGRWAFPDSLLGVSINLTAKEV